MKCSAERCCFSNEGIINEERRMREREHRELVYRLERKIFLDGYTRAFGMGCGPCCLCDTCDLQIECSFPEKARPSMEACGIDVYSTMANGGMELKVVRRREDPYTMVGLVLIE